MKRRSTGDPVWRAFEQLIARIEADSGAAALAVKSPDRIRCLVTGQMREVDASIRSKVGTADVLITIECRKRKKVQDVTWIEQLAAKKASIGAHQTIAVSASGFSAEAREVASRVGVSLRTLSEITVDDLNRLLGLDFVIFWHKGCMCTGVWVRARGGEDTDEPLRSDIVLSPDTDLSAPIFSAPAEGRSWSINDIWGDVQSALNPYKDIEKSAPPVTRTARIPYSESVLVEIEGNKTEIGWVFLSVATWIVPEFVTLAEALKVQYDTSDGEALQRVEFTSNRTKEWRVTAQAPANSNDFSAVRTSEDRPGE